MVLFVCSGMDRSNVKNFFPTSIGKTLVGEGQTAQNN